jgi:hypothetical protein
MNANLIIFSVLAVLGIFGYLYVRRNDKLAE